MNTKTALIRILSNSTDVAATKWLYNVAVDIGLAYLRYRIRTGTLDLDFLHCDEAYVAQTSIAEMFARDENNSFKCFNNCSLLSDVEECDLQNVEIHYKRVVITKVRDGVYSLFKQHDSQLNRIMRNLRTALAEYQEFKLTGSGTLYYGNILGQHEYLPVEILEQIILSAAKKSTNSPQLLENLIDSFKEYHDYNIAVSFTELALLIRASGYSEYQTKKSETEGTDEKAELACLKAVVEKALRKVKVQYKTGYVEKKKMPGWLFESYMNSIQNFYIAKLEMGESAESSIFYYLKEEIPGLVNEEYRSQHRVTVEYLIKRSREQISFDYRNI